MDYTLAPTISRKADILPGVVQSPLLQANARSRPLRKLSPPPSLLLQVSKELPEVHLVSRLGVRQNMLVGLLLVNFRDNRRVTLPVIRMAVPALDPPDYVVMVPPMVLALALFEELTSMASFPESLSARLLDPVELLNLSFLL